eukprot:EG_transcript_1357
MYPDSDYDEGSSERQDSSEPVTPSSPYPTTPGFPSPTLFHSPANSSCPSSPFAGPGPGSPHFERSGSQRRSRSASFGAGSSNIQVYVRARPFSAKELEKDAKPILCMDGGEIELLDPKIDGKVRGTYRYTAAFDSTDPEAPNFAGQKAVYDVMGKQILDNVFEGYNACLLAYGQTGSGKTYTMMGSLTGQDVGIIPRLCAHLFARIEAIKALRPASFQVEAMYCEIYNEKVKDLLAPKGKSGPSLKIRQSGKAGTVVEGLSGHPVQNMEGVLRLIHRGNERRTTAATDLNDQSSRSHAVFTLHVTQIRIQARGADQVQTKEIKSLVHLVDLAGSERIKLSGVKGQQLEEAKNINLSLSTLGRVIECLVQSANTGKALEAPYRESALTWMLRNSFGGNSKTIMVATVSPSANSFEETQSTLRYASRAKKVVNKAVVNVREEVKLMSDLQFEIDDLRNQLQDVLPQELMEQEERIASLSEQLHFFQQMATELQDQTESVKQQWALSAKEKEEQLVREAAERERLQRQYEALEREHQQALHQRQEHVSRLQSELADRENAIRELTESQLAECHARISELERQGADFRGREVYQNNRIHQLQTELEMARYEVRDLHSLLEERDAYIATLEAPSVRLAAADAVLAEVQRDRDRLVEALHSASLQAAMAEAQMGQLRLHRDDLEARLGELLAEGRGREERLTELTAEAREAEKRLAVLECQKVQAELQRTEAAASLQEAQRELEAAQRQRMELLRQRELDLERIRALEVELRSSRRAEQTAGQARDSLEDELKRQQELVKTLQANGAVTDARLTELQRERDRLRDTLCSASSDSTVAATQVAALRAHREQLEGRVKELLEETSAKDAKVNALLRESMDLSKRLAVLECERTEAGMQHAQAGVMLQKAEQALEEVNLHRAELLRKLDTERAQASKLEAKLKNLQRSEQDLRRKADTLQEQATTARQAEQQARQEVEGLRQELAALREAHATNETRRASAAALQHQAADAEGRAARAEQEAERLRQRLERWAGHTSALLLTLHQDGGRALRTAECEQRQGLHRLATDARCRLQLERKCADLTSENERLRAEAAREAAAAAEEAAAQRREAEALHRAAEQEKA